MIRILTLALLLYIFMAGCARQIPPTGGDRDETPPQLVLSEPENKTLNFSGQEIVLEFDEYIKEDNLLKQLIITPRIDHGYKSRLIKKQLKLLFEQPFDENTTYTLNFREGIKDITESNPVENLKFVFSTGNYLDSISVDGTIKDLLTGEPVKEATVSLYNANDTLDIFNSQPVYLTKTEEDGTYEIDNIKNGFYKIFASVDNNQNLKTESQSEAYGFKTEPIDLQDSLTGLNLTVQHLDIRPIKILSARPVGHNFEIKLNKFLTDYILSTNAEVELASKLADENRTIRIYKPPMVIDSLEAFIQVIDSSESSITDTLFVKFIESSRALDKGTIEITPKNDEAIEAVFSGKILFNKPVKSIINDTMFFAYDSTNITAINPDSSLVWNKYRTEATLTKLLDPSLLTSATTEKSPGIRAKSKPAENKKPVKKQSKLRLYFGFGSFVSVEDDTFPAVERNYTFKKSEDYGVIAGSVLTDQQSFIIQLVDKELHVIETLASTSENPISNYRFGGLKPGDYGFRILIDENQNGKWNSGNYLKQLEPEKIVFYVNPDDNGPTINLIKNWELTQIDLRF